MGSPQPQCVVEMAVDALGIVASLVQRLEVRIARRDLADVLGPVEPRGASPTIERRRPGADRGRQLERQVDHADADADADAKGTHTTQYFEIFANRGTAELR